MSIPLSQLSLISFAAAVDPVRWGYDAPECIAFPAFFKLYPQCAEYLPEFQSRLERGQVKADVWLVRQSQSDMQFIEDVCREAVRRGYSDHSWVIQPYIRTGFLTAVVTIWRPDQGVPANRVICSKHIPVYLEGDLSVATPQRRNDLSDAEQVELLTDIPILMDVYGRFRREGVMPASITPETVEFTDAYCKDTDYKKTKECLFKLLERTPTAAVVLANIGYVFLVDGKEHWAEWYLQMAKLFAPEKSPLALDNAIKWCRERSEDRRKAKMECHLARPKRWWQVWKPSDADVTNLMRNIDGDQIYVVEALLERDRRLIHAEDKDYGTALHRAAIKGRTAVAKMLISRGANVRARMGRHRSTSLHNAAQMGNLDIVKLLIAEGADVNARDREGKTPLDTAAYGGSVQAIELLLGCGGRSGGSAVAHAITVFGHTRVVEYLLDRGFPLTAWHGESPLHWAASSGFDGIADLLIRRGADVNARDTYGRTPLHAAAGSRDEDAGQVLEGFCPRDTYDVVTVLIAKGADVNARDKRGKTPMDVAVGNRRVSAVLALDAHMDNLSWRKRELFLRERQTTKGDGLSHP